MQPLINQETETNHSFDFSFANILKTLHGVVIEIYGYWVLLSGNTYPHKEIISNLGFKFSGEKRSWYWIPTINTSKYKRGSKSMKNIRQEFGQQNN